MDRRPDTMLSSAGRGGWHHAVSTDQVHWQDRGINPIERQENYQGMNSLESPCSGFVTVDDDGIPCSGFRQCGSSHGTTGLNPKAHAWDVPLEVRCAEDDNMCDNPPLCRHACKRPDRQRCATAGPSGARPSTSSRTTTTARCRTIPPVRGWTTTASGMPRYRLTAA